MEDHDDSGAIAAVTVICMFFLSLVILICKLRCMSEENIDIDEDQAREESLQRRECYNRQSLLPSRYPPRPTEQSPLLQNSQEQTYGSLFNDFSIGNAPTDEESCNVNIYHEEQCIICQDCPREVVLVPCGHLSLCKRCGDLVKVQNQSCPVCRQRIDQVILVYK